MVLSQPKVVYDCPCGQQHESIGRIGGLPILLCPQAPDNALYFWRDKPVLTTGKPVERKSKK